MQRIRHEKTSGERGAWFTALIAVLFLFLFVLIVSVILFVAQGREFGGLRVSAPSGIEKSEQTIVEDTRFPVGVDPEHKEIVENPTVDSYFEQHILVKSGGTGKHTSWIRQAVGKLALMDWYQNLASLSSRLLVIQSGERGEEVAQHFAKILGWNKVERDGFIQRVTESVPVLQDGKFFPGKYTVSKDAKPEDVAPLILEKFTAEVMQRYGSTTESIVPIQDALTIASLLEREAYDFNDMRQISGVIWNRLFIDMNLQIDATLQYAKGESPREPWWPKVVPRDKYIESEYNTYENDGLPPGPIANPSLEAILAALNPKKTDCLYYFHDADAGFHCTETYKEHVELLKQYYGRGK